MTGRNIHALADMQGLPLRTAIQSSGVQDFPFDEQPLERFLIRWNHVIEKESLRFKELEHVLIRKSRATYSGHALAQADFSFFSPPRFKRSPLSSRSRPQSDDSREVVFPAALQHPVWAMASDVLERPLDGSISVNRDLTALALLRLSTAASALWVSIQLCRDADRAHLLIDAVGAIVAAYSAYGLLSYALFSSAILSFVNRNSFATYAGLGLVATTGMIMRLYRHEVRAEAGSLSHRFALFIEATGRRGWFLLETGLVTLAALLGTGSRGGVAAAALGLFGLLTLTFARHSRRGGERIEAGCLRGGGRTSSRPAWRQAFSALWRYRQTKRSRPAWRQAFSALWRYRQTKRQPR